MAPFSQDDYIAFSLCLLCISILRRRMRNRARQGRRWTRDWLRRRRRQRSTFHTLVQELNREDQMEFKNYFRMDKATFNMLVSTWSIKSSIMSFVHKSFLFSSFSHAFFSPHFTMCICYCKQNLHHSKTQL